MNKKIFCIFTLVLILVLLLCGCGEKSNYKKAITMYENGQYEEAADKFSKLGNFENSSEMVQACKYNLGIKMIEEQNYEDDISLLEQIESYKDTSDLINSAKLELQIIQYKDVIDALKSETWYYNGGTENSLKAIYFTEKYANISHIYYDGNGKHDISSDNVIYMLDDSHITITLNDNEILTIPYTLSNGKVVLGENEYFTAEEIDAGLQGFWKDTSTSFVLGVFCRTEHNIYINHGTITYEYAAPAQNSFNNEYYYYGPYEGTYTINFGGFDTDVRNGHYWFYNIIDGEIVLLHYDRTCTHTDCLPGENGYSF